MEVESKSKNCFFHTPDKELIKRTLAPEKDLGSQFFFKLTLNLNISL